MVRGRGLLSTRAANVCRSLNLRSLALKATGKVGVTSTPGCFHNGGQWDGARPEATSRRNQDAIKTSTEATTSETIAILLPCFCPRDGEPGQLEFSKSVTLSEAS